MFLQRKALYNLIRLNVTRVETGGVKLADLQPWQVANYREKRTEELFFELSELNIHIGVEDFERYGRNFEAPEEIVETIAEHRQPLEKDRIFLIMFELWRRFFPEKRTISIFCDELDYQIMAYDLERPNEMADTLAALQLLLEEHVDQGLDPRQAFQLIQLYCANDVESFLFDYILAEIEEGNKKYAVDLIDGFKRFVNHSIWFAYLEARCTIFDEPEEGYEKLEQMVQTQVDETTSLDLLEEMLFFLANSGNHSLFYLLAKKTLSFLKTEEDFKVYLEACYAHYDYLELKGPALAIAKIYYNRSGKADSEPLSFSDPEVLEMQAILNQKLHFAEE